MCQGTGGASRAKGIERSAVSDLSSLISEQRKTSHPGGAPRELRPEIPHRSVSHFIKVNHSYGKAFCEKGRTKFCGS